ncbi:hypothetical protein MVLG_03884 [Microbotryum lychnidis-dioicae p1A1 Lamole]|uniref:Uncharacterized protein n=1 Tax=Microbotryum lychnidis-dioicae (strain p1A1 Lamole / MvSl-1064) TaxID=683840 RepID=U5H9J4_USTV1|nr:hypothetical protein MVLG_03884 [Microbotryum lychnidis-dioicae p1A1 Lamole]|eukprot:KDE05794.1 hypothetical protein MVLG_03884 [Microbotryum lychnidis-dioicae p1A1 Lamole]
MSLPPHNKDDPIPGTPRRTVDAVNHIREAFQDGVLTADARKDLLVFSAFAGQLLAARYETLDVARLE